MIEEKIMETMNQINYGYIGNDGKNIYETEDGKWNTTFPFIYKLLSPNELLDKKFGVCWDQVELERFLFEKENINVKTFFICTYENKMFPTHTFLTYKKGNKFYWFEHSWEPYRGIHEFKSERELIEEVKNKFITEKGFPTVVYEYTKPKYGINVEDFYKHCENGKFYGNY